MAAQAVVAEIVQETGKRRPTYLEDISRIPSHLIEDECSVRAVANRVRYISSFLSHFRLTPPKAK
jgi:hypothetical protein